MASKETEWQMEIHNRLQEYKQTIRAVPGQLPDVEDIFLRIRQVAPKWLATIDLTDMFFGIPLHPNSREITTFSWEGKQYRFTSKKAAQL